jgi:glutamyl-tRNA reductase
MSVVVIGLEHSKAPLDVLERTTVPEPEVGKVLAQLSAYENVREVALLSTCLRTEIYAVVDRFHDAVDDVTTLLADRSGLSHADVDGLESVYFDRGVASHLFKIAAGLESAVPGETEVLGQVRRSLERATDEGTVGPTLTALFRSAIAAGRRVRAETGIARGTTSFSYAACELARTRLGDELDGAAVVVVGAGSLGTGVVTALSDERHVPRIGSLKVLNRTVARAEELVGGAGLAGTASAGGLGELAEAVRGARLVVLAAETEEPLLTPADLAGRTGEPLLIVDLGMPRNADVAVGALTGVELVGIADLAHSVDRAVDERRAAIGEAEAIVADEVARYLEDQRGRGAAPIVVAIRESVEAIRLAELERRRSDLADLTDAQRDAVEALTRSLMAKVVHEPTVALKEAAGTPRADRLVEATRLLFGL